MRVPPDETPADARRPAETLKQILIDRMAQVLPERDLAIAAERFLESEPKTQEQLAAEYGVRKARISVIEQRALYKIRNSDGGATLCEIVDYRKAVGLPELKKLVRA